MKKQLFIAMLLIIIICFSTVASAVENFNSQTTPSGVLISELEQFVDDYVTKYIGSAIAGTSIVFLQNGETLLSKSYGYADIENGVLIDEDTVFEWGSSSKLLVWVSVMQLVERGKIDLNTDIREYLPENFFRRLRFDSPITMYNLMNHNAGWENLQTDIFTSSTQGVIGLEEGLRKFEPKQIFEPGAFVAYSNYGTALAGYIVERISGQPFYEYVNDNILSVLGMNNTAIHPYQADNAFVTERRVNIRGYTRTNGILTRARLDPAYINYMYPAGSAIGTANDAAKFLSALIPAEGMTSLLFNNNATLNEMLSVSYSYGDGFPGLAHGFFEEYYNVTTIGHGGNTAGFTAYLTVSPECGYGLVVLTNQADSSAFATRLAKALFGDYISEYTGTLPDIRSLNNLEGMYLTAQRAGSGFMKLTGKLPQSSLKIIDSNTFSFLGIEFIQISPFVFKNRTDTGIEAIDLSSIFLYLTVENNNVTRVSMIPMDFIRISGIDVFTTYLNLTLIIICVVYMIAAVLIIIIGGIKNKIKKKPPSLVKKLNIALNLSGAVVIANYLFMIIRVVQFTSHNALMPNFGINIAYIIFAPFCSFLIFKNINKSELSKGSKLFCIVSCIVSIIMAVLMILWEFYK